MQSLRRHLSIIWGCVFFDRRVISSDYQWHWDCDTCSMGKAQVVLLILGASLSAGCGDPPPIYITEPAAVQKPANSAQKDLFSSWTGSNGFLNLTGRTFGTGSAVVGLGAGECSVGAIMVGAQASGTITIAGSNYNGAGNHGVDPGCAILNGSYTYSVAVAAGTSTLTLYGPVAGTCDTYQ